MAQRQLLYGDGLALIFLRSFFLVVTADGNPLLAVVVTEGGFWEIFPDAATA